MYRRIKDLKQAPSGTFDDLDDFFEAEMNRVVSSGSESTETDAVLLEEIRKLGSQDKIPMSSDILKYYADLHRNKKISNDLFELAMVVLSAPTNQVSVERSFSALSTLLQQRRLKMTGTKIDDVLICKVNQELLTLVNFEKMNVEQKKVEQMNVEQVIVKEEKK